MPQRINPIFAQFRTSQAFCTSKAFFTTLGLFLVTALLSGCSGSQTTIPNPFNMADRVPPPIVRTPAPGSAQPYYPANSAAPAYSAPGSVTSPPATFQPGVQQQPLQPAPGFTPQPTFQSQPQPYGALPTNNPAQQIASKPGDSIAIPTDSTSLRFGSQTAPSSLKTQPTYVAANRSMPATANSWVSGSAPVRSQATTQLATNSSTSSSNSLRVRVPGASNYDRRPISVASLQPAPKQVQIQPLPANDPNETVGWR